MRKGSVVTGRMAGAFRRQVRRGAMAGRIAHARLATQLFCFGHPDAETRGMHAVYNADARHQRSRVLQAALNSHVVPELARLAAAPLGGGRAQQMLARIKGLCGMASEAWTASHRSLSGPCSTDPRQLVDGGITQCFQCGKGMAVSAVPKRI